MRLFYTEIIDEKHIFALAENEAKHIVKVLRKKVGDTIFLTNGKGFLFTCKIIEITKRQVLLSVIEKKIMPLDREYYLHIAIAPTKNIERFEWFVEKSVEIGIDEITPLITKYSERKTLKKERIERIIISAMKQSLKYKKPIVNEIMPITDFLKKNLEGSKFISFCNAEERLSKKILSKRNIFLVGPEGGFDITEVEFAKNKGFLPVSLSQSRLRTETAGVFLAGLINFLNR